jgi:hypothetical protein
MELSNVLQVNLSGSSINDITPPQQFLSSSTTTDNKKNGSQQQLDGTPVARSGWT